MKYTKDEVKAMDEYHKMVFNDMLWRVTAMVERDKELERKIDKILEVVPSKTEK